MVHIPAKFRENTSNAFLSYSAKTKCDGRTDGGGGRCNISHPGPSAPREIKITKSQFKHCSKSLIWLLGSHIWSLFAQIHMNSWPKLNQVKLELVRTLFKIHLASGKLYLAIFCPNSHEKLTKIKIRSCILFKHCSESLI